ncbi:MAG TPA: type 1 glutamine amidotransferase domain-containing protein [Gemmatimonadales bacterium]|nr:type 1 glutamine amidotransferase domain-containing protein [Gemmatimonadales bacterium]
MDQKLTGRKVAVLAADGFEQVELDVPVKALRDAGATVEIVSSRTGTIKGVDGGAPGEELKVDRAVSDAHAADYAALLLPGGVKNPDSLRQDADAVKFVKQMLEMNKPVAAICHAPWVLVETGLMRGRTVTSYPSLKTDLENAGATWVDREVVSDERLLTSRKPADLPAFSKALVSMLHESIQERELDDMVEQSFPASDPLSVSSSTIASSGPEQEAR